jgi:hypothetical protein
MTLKRAGGMKISIASTVGGATALPVPMLKQEQTLWCWAACVQMILRYDQPHSTVTQCMLANTAFGNRSCCSSPQSSLCNRTLPIASVTPQWASNGYNSAHVRAPLQWSALLNEMYNKRPVECALIWNDGGGHAVLIVGVEEDSAMGQWVTVHDPWELKKNVLYSDLLNAYGRGVWRDSWAQIVGT